MSPIADRILRRGNPKKNQEIQPMPSAKKPRSKISRRECYPMLPVSMKGNPGEEEEASAVEVSASSSYFPSDISKEKILNVDQHPKKRSRSSRQIKETELKMRRSGSENQLRPEKRSFFDTEVFFGDDSRPITRSYLKQKENLKSALSKSIGVDSHSGADARKAEGASDKGLKQVISSSEGTANGASVITFSEAEKERPPAPEILPESTSGSIAKLSSRPALSEISQNYAPDESGSDSKSDDDCESEFYSDLACSEQLSGEDESSVYLTCSEFGSGSGSSWYSSAIFESPEEFSEKSPGDTVPASYALFRTYAQQLTFSRFHHEQPREPSDPMEDIFSGEFTLLRFEDESDEESYKTLRRRESAHALLHDYAEEYFSTTDYGDLIVQQRLVMVNWMVEHSSVNRLQCETLFLGVSMLDRFLSKAFFKSKRNLQILGVSCITLATRIEENQHFNRFYLKAAKVGVEVENLAKYLAVISLLDHKRLCFWPSTVAAGLVILASLVSNNDSSCQWVMETHVRTKNDDLPECTQVPPLHPSHA
ncbi:Cyclin-SDS-like [Acorus calamus]|uniref:Cyclin-SDS-like n=1 Tax=Acorus calamus TaxID=4465 RepID=A0AAV9CG15_ACOCL|nr:Cyclin-SDS-like [Acorus calamus]